MVSVPSIISTCRSPSDKNAPAMLSRKSFLLRCVPIFLLNLKKMQSPLGNFRRKRWETGQHLLSRYIDAQLSDDYG